MGNKLSEPLDDFKEREIEIINLMADGLSNKEIADQLLITKETVRWYNKQIYSKLGTSRRIEAIALAREMNLVGDPETVDTQSVQHKLPVTTGPFIGRDDELTELSDLLGNSDIRLLSIIATGGMGKSRLSLELGHLLKANYQHGIVFIDLAPIRNPDDIAKFALSSLGMSITENQSPEEVLLNYCSEKELLLIFDNFEHVLSGAILLTDILEVSPNVKMIATSRERLNLRVETVFYLEPISEYGDALFIEVATMMRPNFVISEDDLVDVQHIVELVGGLPLGLILAATWVDTLSIREIVEEIQASLDFLSAEMGDMPDRQRSIHAVVDPTWKRLNKKEQKAFMWASVFRSGFTREIFQQVTGASIRTLQTLLNCSLFSHGHGRRYDMHPLLRQYAREKLEDHDMLKEAKQSHLQAFLDYASHHAEKMYNGYYLKSLENLDIEQDNFRAALDWSIQGTNINDGISLILSLCNFWLIRSQAMEAVYYIEQALTHKQDAALYYWSGNFHNRLGHNEHAFEDIQKSIDLALEAKTYDILAQSYRQLGHIIGNTKPDKAKQLIEQALTIAQDLDDSRVIATCHNSFANVLFMMNGDTDIIFDHCQKAMNIYEQLGDLRGISFVTYNMATHYAKQGNMKGAREYCEQSLTIKEQIGDKAGVARRLSVLAQWNILEEELEQAVGYITESRAICEEIGELPRLIYTLLIEGILYLVMHQYDQAQQTLERSLEISYTIKNNERVESLHSYLALLHIIQDRLDHAKQHIIDALEAHSKISSGWMSLIAYATYLWKIREFEACVPMSAIMFHRADDNDIGDRYFLKPLLYRIQQQIGEEAWHDAVDKAEDITIEQLYQGIMENLQI